MKRVYRIASVNLLALFVFAAAEAHAQPAEQAIVDLNNQAMEAYNSLDVNRAISLLDQALSTAQRAGIGSGQLVGGTYLNLGIVQIGGVGNRQLGFEHFVRACCLFPSIQLDPLISTPEIASAFQQAQQSAASGGCAAVGLAATAPAAPVMQPVAPAQPVMQPVVPVQPVMQPVMQPGVLAGPVQIIHQPPVPQVSQAPLPLYAELSNTVGVAKVKLYYRGLGMDNFKSIDMMPFGTGFAYQISCREVWEPKIRYYITATDADDRIVATAGSAQSPIEAAIVSSLKGPGPSLPGASSPGVCQEVECPPGVSGEACKKPLFHGIGQGCDRDGDCQPGLACQDDMCVIPGATGDLDTWHVDDGWTPTVKLGDFARAFAQIGFTMAFSWLSPGKITDSGPPRSYPPFKTDGSFNEFSPWVPDADSYDIDPTTQTDRLAPPGCPADGVRTFASAGGQNPSRYCAKVAATGLAFSPAMRANVGYFILPRLSVAAIFRLQFSHGVTTLAGMLLGGRLEYMILDPREKGLMISAFLGGTVGQIQVKAPASTGQTATPFIISGMGGAHAGATVRYRFHRNIGVFASPEVDFQFPDYLFNIDLTLGPEVSF